MGYQNILTASLFRALSIRTLSVSGRVVLCMPGCVGEPKIPSRPRRWNRIYRDEVRLEANSLSLVERCTHPAPVGRVDVNVTPEREVEEGVEKDVDEGCKP